MTGSASLSAIAVLENPRAIENSKTVLFDAHLYFQDTHGPDPGLASLRYYNASELSFEQVGVYFVHVNIARMEHEVSSVAVLDGLSKEKYVLVGDIVSIIPAAVRDIADVKYRPFVNVSGIVTSVNNTDKTFHLAPETYVHALKNFTAQSLGAKMPDPRVGHYVSVSGHLHRVIRRLEDNMADFFDVELDKITYLGPPYTPPSSPSSGIPTALAGKIRFSYTESPCLCKKRKISETSV
ncbi:hypothetical protein ARMSODRAFT_1059581 [Armillaria solidipes]|uniref:Uncharacterized protein n=1 Tax=Armillaria solidipes TaxID=1076256 RepID=A0A2H3BYD7_9AGAR|nr:hypothetical protein ARMSODRAFT_1059581 [Armillaria solidipes]